MDKLATGATRLGVQLTSRQLGQFQLYYQELVDWNKRVNLTRIVDYEEVQIKHFLDPLTVTLAFQKGEMESPSFRLLDVGTGAGMPGVPLKILFPNLKLALLDSIAKKTAFVRHLVKMLGLEDVDIVTARAEELAHQEGYREQFDLVLCRAVAQLPTITELTLPFCRVGGTFVAQKKGEVGEEVRMASRAIDILGGKLRDIKGIALGEFEEERYLIIIDKVSATPPKYPRRPGVPSRRPLG